MQRRPKTTQTLGTVVLLLLLLVVVRCAPALDSVGKTCKTDDQCNMPYIVCKIEDSRTEGTYQHKALFPMLGNEVLGLILMTLLLSVASLVAISGGTIVLPFAIYLLGLTSNQAVAMANAITVLSTGVKYAVSLRNKSAFSEWKTAVDYNAALTLLPMNVMLSVIGGIASSVFPAVLTLIIMVLCILQAVYNGIRNLRRLNQAEREKQLAAAQANEPKALPEPQPESNRKLAELGEQELAALKIPGESEQPVVQPANPPTAEAQVSEVRIAKLEEVPKAENAAPQKMVTQEHEKMIEDQRKIEGNNFHWPKFLPIIGMILLSVLVSLLRPGKTPTSLVGIKKCSAGDYLVLIGFAIIMAFLPFYAYNLIQKEQAHKDKIGWVKAKDEVYLDKNKFIFSNVWSGVSGLISTLLGIGGGILLNPLMAILHYLPATASWTININALVGRFAAVIVHIIYGDLLYDYVLFCGVIIAVVIFFSENVVNYYLLKKLKSQRPYAMIFLAVCTICLILNVLVGVDTWIADANKGIDVWVFKPLC